jgi:hypothetical protein
VPWSVETGIENWLLLMGKLSVPGFPQGVEKLDCVPEKVKQYMVSLSATKKLTVPEPPPN